MAQIIYIAGLGHSGSTLLDLSLGTLPGVVGLGEVKTLLDENARERHLKSLCSCGKKGTECDFWKNFSSIISDTSPMEARYNELLSYFGSKYGMDAILVDSSKNNYRYLEALKKQHRVSVIYLTRDIRSWSYSRYLSKGGSMIYLALRWWLENRKVLNGFKKMGFDPIPVGYEELALYPEYSLQKLAGRLNLPFEDRLLIPAKSSSHIISGNIARVDPEKLKGWQYDARWLIAPRHLFWPLLFIPYRKMHKKLVYGNITADGIHGFHLFGTHRKNKLHREFN